MYFVTRHYNEMFMQWRHIHIVDFLTTAMKVREGKTQELIQTLEWNAQVQLVYAQSEKDIDTDMALEYAHRILYFYTNKYDIEVAPPLKNLPPPVKPLSEKMIMELLNFPVPDTWPEGFSELPPESTP